MGSGKSTLGRMLVKLKGIDFIDLDAYIENRYHKSIKELFAEYGELGFREIEKQMLHEVADMNDVVIACGGGTPCYSDNIEYINAHGRSVWLEAPVSVLHSRLLRGKHKRPLISDLSSDDLLSFITDGLAGREVYYSQAHSRFCTSMLETEEEREITASRFIKEFFD